MYARKTSASSKRTRDVELEGQEAQRATRRQQELSSAIGGTKASHTRTREPGCYVPHVVVASGQGWRKWTEWGSERGGGQRGRRERSGHGRERVPVPMTRGGLSIPVLISSQVPRGCREVGGGRGQPRRHVVLVLVMLSS